MTRRDGATLMLYDKEGNVLLQHRTDDAPRYPGMWSAFGGGIEEGETPEQALHRELLEELEYRVTTPRLLAVEEYTDMHGTEFNFVEEYDETQPLILHEGRGYSWFTIPEALKLPLSDYRRNMILKLQEYLDAHA